MIFTENMRRFMQQENRNPLLGQAFDDEQCDHACIKQEPIFEFGLYSDDNGVKSPLSTIHNTSNSSNTDNSNSKLPWNSSSEDSTLFTTDNFLCDDEDQLLSPSTICKTPFVEPKIENVDRLFELSDETKVMSFDDFQHNTPTLDFEQEVLKYSKVVEDQHQKIVLSFKQERPLPCVEDATIMSQQESMEVFFVASEETVMDSQEPTMNPRAIFEDVVEHNYSTEQEAVSVTKYVSNKVVEEKVAAKGAVPKLKLNMPLRRAFDSQEVVSTPEITNEILDLEREFNLIAYINSNNIEAEVVKVEDIKPVPQPTRIERKRKSTISVDLLAEESLPAPKIHSYNTRTRASSPSTSVTSDYINPSSVASTSSEDSYITSFSKGSSKKRGRPARPVEDLLDPAKIAQLGPEEGRYREQRNKNNEASRRSRMNRKDREGKLEEEAQELEDRNRKLEELEKKLALKCARWKEALMKVALLE